LSSVSCHPSFQAFYIARKKREKNKKQNKTKARTQHEPLEVEVGGVDKKMSNFFHVRLIQQRSIKKKHLLRIFAIDLSRSNKKTHFLFYAELKPPKKDIYIKIYLFFPD